MAEIATLDAGAFDPLASNYDSAFTQRAPARFLRTLVWSHLEPHVEAGCWALDLGCGTGEDAMWLARKGCHVTAVDGSPLMLELTAQKDTNVRSQCAACAGWSLPICDLEFWSIELRARS
jgi:ubiquinone/menaquinone biosynthesis C-methylase UbiE